MEKYTPESEQPSYPTPEGIDPEHFRRVVRILSNTTGEFYHNKNGGIVSFHKNATKSGSYKPFIDSVLEQAEKEIRENSVIAQVCHPQSTHTFTQKRDMLAKILNREPFPPEQTHTDEFGDEEPTRLD